jgi:hypothetical protein
VASYTYVLTTIDTKFQRSTGAKNCSQMPSGKLEPPSTHFFYTVRTRGWVITMINNGCLCTYLPTRVHVEFQVPRVQKRGSRRSRREDSNLLHLNVHHNLKLCVSNHGAMINGLSIRAFQPNLGRNGGERREPKQNLTFWGVPSGGIEPPASRLLRQEGIFIECGRSP